MATVHNVMRLMHGGYVGWFRDIRMVTTLVNIIVQVMNMSKSRPKQIKPEDLFNLGLFVDAPEEGPWIDPIHRAIMQKDIDEGNT